MPEWIGEVLEAATPYWPFIVQVVIIWYLGQFFKKRVWTKKRALKNDFFEIMRDTLRLHPIAAGAVWGAMYPFLPAVAFVTTRGGAIYEGLFAGFVSMAGHTALEYIAEKRNIGWLLKVLHDTVPARDTLVPGGEKDGKVE